MRPVGLAFLIATLAAGAASAGSKADVDFNPKADFARYRTWGWLPDREKALRGPWSDPTIRARFETMLGNHLRETGLVPAAADATPDLFVSYRGDIGAGKEISTSMGGLSSMDNPLYTTVHFREQTATLMVDLVDARSKALAWRLYLDETIRGPNDPPDKIAKALDTGFAKYPPTKAEIEKKVKQLEKSAR